MGSRNSGNCSSAMTSSRLALKVLVITTIVCGTFAFTATGTTPVTELKEETSRILAERVKTGHWQTLSATSGGEGTEKWIPATPATDMVVTEDQAERAGPCEPTPSPSPTPSDYAINHCGQEPGDVIGSRRRIVTRRRRDSFTAAQRAQQAQRDAAAAKQAQWAAQQVAQGATGGATRRRRATDPYLGVFG